MAKTIIIDGVIGWDINPRQIREKLSNAKGKDINVEISSPGGWVEDGILIYNLFKNYTGYVTMHIMGMAASMASYIPLAGDKIKAEKNSRWLIHNPWGLVIGNQHDLRKEADDIESISNILAEEYARKTGKSLSEIHELMDNETFFYGDEIKEAGFIDEIIPSEKVKSSKKQALIETKASIKNLYSSMKESEKARDDLSKAAALFKNDVNKNNNSLDVENIEITNYASDSNFETEIENQQKKELENNNNKINGGKNYMTKDELKAQFPDLFNSFGEEKNQAVANETKRCMSYVEAMETLPECSKIYKDAIGTGKEVNDVSVFSAVQAALKAQSETSNAGNEQIENVVIDEPEKP
ncbi:Clp protease ClpP, partial [Candidatus Pacearchaeota archaeon]|nr:Clp protease ClpP [Candidatus Pacearchaeota archaeon]